MPGSSLSNNVTDNFSSTMGNMPQANNNLPYGMNANNRTMMDNFEKSFQPSPIIAPMNLGLDTGAQPESPWLGGNNMLNKQNKNQSSSDLGVRSHNSSH